MMSDISLIRKKRMGCYVSWSRNAAFYPTDKDDLVSAYARGVRFRFHSIKWLRWNEFIVYYYVIHSTAMLV